MFIKKSQIRQLINEALNEAPKTYVLPDGKEVPFASEDHINHTKSTLDALTHLRDKSPRANKNTYSSASRKVYGDAARQLRNELEDILKLSELLQSETEEAIEEFEEHEAEEAEERQLNEQVSGELVNVFHTKVDALAREFINKVVDVLEERLAQSAFKFSDTKAWDKLVKSRTERLRRNADVLVKSLIQHLHRVMSDLSTADTTSEKQAEPAQLGAKKK